ncbi:hypothetical protein ACLOJK_030976 [Asimina triloba]
MAGPSSLAAQCDMEEGRNAHTDIDVLSLYDLEEETFSEGKSEIEFDVRIKYSAELVYITEEEDTDSEWEDIDVDVEHVNVSESSNRESDQLKQVAAVMKQRSRNQVTRKRQKVKEKKNKDLKLEVPGSAKRLKIRERAVLTGVFSKYGGKADTGSSSSNITNVERDTSCAKCYDFLSEILSSFVGLGGLGFTNYQDCKVRSLSTPPKEGHRPLNERVTPSPLSL